MSSPALTRLSEDLLIQSNLPVAKCREKISQSGHVVGIVVSGAGPTLSNAVDTFAAELFLSTNFVKYQEGHSTQDLDLHDVARQAKDFTVRVECWQ